MRIVDLSVPTGPGPGEPLPPTIDYEDHTRVSERWLKPVRHFTPR